MATTYESILKDQVSANGVQVLSGWGAEFASGEASRAEFIDVLGKQQTYFRSVVDHTLAGDMGQDGPIQESEGIGAEQFRLLDGILKKGAWEQNPLLAEEFIEAVENLRNRKYQRPEWLNKLLAEPAHQ